MMLQLAILLVIAGACAYSAWDIEENNYPVAFSRWVATIVLSSVVVICVIFCYKIIERQF